MRNKNKLSWLLRYCPISRRPFSPFRFLNHNQHSQKKKSIAIARGPIRILQSHGIQHDVPDYRSRDTCFITLRQIDNAKRYYPMKNYHIRYSCHNIISNVYVEFVPLINSTYTFLSLKCDSAIHIILHFLDGNALIYIIFLI